MKNTKIISSPAERVKKTLQIAYWASTWDEKAIWMQKEVTNSATWNTIKIHKKDLYDNLLGFWAISMQDILKEVDEKTKKLMESTKIDELPAQDIVATDFLQWKFDSWSPYNISKERIALLQKWFSMLDKKKWSVVVIWMRHGHRIWSDLSEQWKKEAQETWYSLEFENTDMLFGTHQTIIESILISLIWWSKWLSPQQAWLALPEPWKNPYKTAQATEFSFTKIWWQKKLTVTTAWASIVLTEEDVKKAYNYIVSYNNNS